MNISPEQTVRDIALAQPSLIRVFERFGIDYCCGGHKPLAQSCQELQLSLDQVIEKLAEAQGSGDKKDEVDWQTAPLANLISHIVRTHHTRVRQELPRIVALSTKVSAKHGTNHAELLRVHELSLLLSEDMTAHLRKEEEVLFPYISRLDGDEGSAPTACFPTVAYPVAVMVQEHESAGAIMAELRKITFNFQAPADGCPTYHGLYSALEDFEKDLHQHIHLENNILFPRAIEMEKKLKVVVS